MSLAPYSFYWNPALSLIGLGPNMTFSRSTTKNAFNASGVLASVSIGVPAIQYHPVTQQCQGVLIEQAATNNLLYSHRAADSGQRPILPPPKPLPPFPGPVPSQPPPAAPPTRRATPAPGPATANDPAAPSPRWPRDRRRPSAGA